MGVNNGYDIGVNGRDLILKTSGKIYVKVAEKFYELDFRNKETEIRKKETEESSESKQQDVVLLDTLSKENYPGDNKIVINNDELYITKGGSYKKVNTGAGAVQTRQVSAPENLSSNNLFVQVEDNVWGLGEVDSGQSLELLSDSSNTWNDYRSFNAVREYYFGDVYGEIDDDIINNIFFNVTSDPPVDWVPKSQSEIESTVLTNVYKNKIQIDITSFKKLYSSFWYTEESFKQEISDYAGPFALLEINKWSPIFSVKNKITIGGCSAIITGLTGEFVIIKFKDFNITLNPDNIKTTNGSLAIYNKGNHAFLDVIKSDLGIYNSSAQTIDDVYVRIGDLSTLDGYSGTGAVFNENVTIKNGPFSLNSDGSGGITTVFMWDSEGNISGQFIDALGQMIQQQNQQIADLTERVKKLES